MLRGAFYVVVAIVTGYLLYKADSWLSRTTPPPAHVVVDTTKRHYLIVMAYDDGRTARQHMFIAHAGLNMAKDRGLTVQKVHEFKLTLVAPSEEGSTLPRYADAEEFFQNWVPFYGDRGNRARAQLEVDRVLKEQEQDHAKLPCLAFVQRYVRSGGWGTDQNPKKMHTELDVLFENVQGATFFGPPGSRKKCQ